MACMQASQGGGYVSTVDKHTVHVWATQQPEWPSLKLHSSKALTASRLTCPPSRASQHKSWHVRHLCCGHSLQSSTHCELIWPGRLKGMQYS